jgi:hypothetical protein
VLRALCDVVPRGTNKCMSSCGRAAFIQALVRQLSCSIALTCLDSQT